MPRANNIETYIVKRIQHELDKNLSSMIDKKISKLQTFANVKQASYRYSRNSLNELGRVIYKTHITNASFLKDFGNSESQFLQLFANEIKKSLLNNF